MQATTSTIISGDHAPDLALPTTDGSSIQLARFWQGQQLLLFFVRHFGCVFCRDQLAQLRDRYGDFRARGGEVVAVTPSDAISAGRFARSLRLPFPVLGDAQRRAYAAYGLFETAFNEIAHPEVLIRTAREIARGNIPTVNLFRSSLTQLGGLFIIAPGGVVRFSHIAKPVFAYPPADTYLAMFDDLP